MVMLSNPEHLLFDLQMEKGVVSSYYRRKSFPKVAT